MKRGEPRVETCRSCGLPFAVDSRHRVPDHLTSRNGELRATTASDARGDVTVVLGADNCAGSGRPSHEQAAKNRAGAARGRVRRTLDLIAPFRTTAAVALDAVLQGDGDRMRADIEVLMRVALYQVRAKGARLAISLVRYEERHTTSPRRGDLYCVLCGELVVANTLRRVRIGVRDPWEQLPTVRRHIEPCALRHLAFDLTPSPGRKLPAEMRDGEP